jgi:hypothetical protein
MSLSSTLAMSLSSTLAMSLFSNIQRKILLDTQRQILSDITILTNHLIENESHLSMAQLILRIAISLIALSLNLILPPPLAILYVTALKYLVKWQTVGHMSDHGAVLESAL